MSVDECRWVSMSVDECRWVSLSVDECRWVSMSVDECRWVSMSVAKCRWVSMSVDECRWVSMSVDECYWMETQKRVICLKRTNEHRHMQHTRNTLIGLAKALYIRWCARKIKACPPCSDKSPTNNTNSGVPWGDFDATYIRIPSHIFITKQQDT
jgi:hypothetical protein